MRLLSNSGTVRPRSLISASDPALSSANSKRSCAAGNEFCATYATASSSVLWPVSVQITFLSRGAISAGELRRPVHGTSSGLPWNRLGPAQLSGLHRDDTEHRPSCSHPATVQVMLGLFLSFARCGSLPISILVGIRGMDSGIAGHLSTQRIAAWAAPDRVTACKANREEGRRSSAFQQLAIGRHLHRGATIFPRGTSDLAPNDVGSGKYRV